jgi:hypothetical protein
MNLQWLGDALDHWKGSLFEYLQAKGTLRNLAVDPMATDQQRWSEEDFSLFARVLRKRRNQIIPHQASLSSRIRYFEEIVHRGDIFLDPDTGIRTSGSASSPKHVRPIELAKLLDSDCRRLVAVYQHISRQKTSVRVDSCLTAIGKHTQVQWCSYESGTVAMVFFCKDLARTQEIATSLCELLGKHAEHRMRSGIVGKNPGTK